MDKATLLSTRARYVEQRTQLATDAQQLMANANAANGAIQLIDELLADLAKAETAPKPDLPLVE